MLNFKPLNFYYKLPGEVQDKYFDNVDYSNRNPAEVESHLHVASFFYEAVMTMDNETYEATEDSGDGEAIKAAALFLIDPFHKVIMENDLYIKYPEYTL